MYSVCERMVILLFLGILSVRDCRERRVPVVWLIAGAVLLFGMGIGRCVQEELAWQEMILGSVPGILLLLIARLSGKAGYADGILLMELGACLGWRESIWLSCFSLLLLSVFSMILLCLRKAKKNTEIPYIPFLTIAFLLKQL